MTQTEVPVEILALGEGENTGGGDDAVAEEAVEVVERGLADAVVVTGARTGSEVDERQLARVRAAITSGAAPDPLSEAKNITVFHLSNIRPRLLLEPQLPTRSSHARIRLRHA